MASGHPPLNGPRFFQAGTGFGVMVGENVGVAVHVGVKVGVIVGVCVSDVVEVGEDPLMEEPLHAISPMLNRNAAGRVFPLRAIRDCQLMGFSLGRGP